MAFFTHLIVGMVSALFLAMSLMGLKPPPDKE